MNSNENSIHCPLCGKLAHGVKLWVKNDVGDILRCMKCGLGFFDPLKLHELADLNPTLYNSKSYYKLLIRTHSDLISRYRTQVKEIYKMVGKKGKLLDVGCSIGMFLNIASSYGFETYGFDINKINLNKAKQFFGIKPLPDNYLNDNDFVNFFDIVTMWDVLEHLPNPVEYLSHLIMVLKPGGLLVVQCPNMESYEFSKFGKNWNWLTPGDHLQFFTPKTLTKVLSAGGFHIIKVKPWMDGLSFSKYMIKLKNRNPTFLFNRLLFKMIKKLNGFFQKVNLNVPIEKVQGIYGWLLQSIHHARRRHSLIKIFAVRP
ncbi:hypothetical protein LCGC14_2276800 [marine sediment metagenome]|uniref:Methyltransferase type 11 domain-containing protein n=1 Tax=marine sediment metagenome TaxID=412755 RepID=A0A0F9CVE0_9ZZZZ